MLNKKKKRAAEVSPPVAARPDLLSFVAKTRCDTQQPAIKLIGRVGGLGVEEKGGHRL